MSDQSAVNENAAPWWVQVRGQAYGPYDLQQMLAYVAENRVLPNSMASHSPYGDWAEVRSFDILMGAARASSFGGAAKPSQNAANIFVHAELISGAHPAFVAALESLGALCELTPNFWLVRTAHGAGVVRNTLSQTLERGDRFVVVDATRDRFAWFNLGPEIDVKIKDVWNAPLRALGAAAR